MSRSLLLRLVDEFCRSWVRYLVPGVLVLALGALSLTRSADAYSSTGTLYVESQSLLSRLTDVQTEDGGGFETPASVMAQRIGSLLQTDGFVRDVALQAGLEPEVEAGMRTLLDVRSSISVTPNGTNLVNVRVGDADPAVAFRLAEATIERFVEWVVEANLSESGAAEDFFTGLLETYRAEAETARADLNRYLAANPGGALDDRPFDQVVEIERLQSIVTAIDDRVADALRKSEDARLAAAQSRGDVEQRLRVVDEPAVPTSPDGGLAEQVLSLAMFVVLAGVLTVAGVVGGTLLDQSLRLPRDTAERLGVPVLATLPDVGRA